MKQNARKLYKLFTLKFNKIIERISDVSKIPATSNGNSLSY